MGLGRDSSTRAALIPGLVHVPHDLSGLCRTLRSGAPRKWALPGVVQRKWQYSPVFSPGESQGWQSLVGCHLWGRTELDMTEAT